jgi:hypothetical protein
VWRWPQLVCCVLLWCRCLLRTTSSVEERPRASTSSGNCRSIHHCRGKESVSQELRLWQVWSRQPWMQVEKIQSQRSLRIGKYLPQLSQHQRLRRETRQGADGSSDGMRRAWIVLLTCRARDGLGDIRRRETGHGKMKISDPR